MADSHVLKRTPRRWAYDLLDPDDNPPFYERIFNLFLAALILITVVVVIIDTVPELHPTLEPWLETLRWISIVVFSTEYLGRVWVAPERPDAPKGFGAYIAWIFSPLALVDLLVIASLAFPELPAALGALRALRLLKLLSLLKLGRTSPALKLIGQVLQNRLPELKSLVVTILVLVTIAASLLYAIESEAGTKGFESIPHSMWWAIVTLTTTGYGDVFPATAIGRLLAAVIMLLGVGVVALPAGIIATGFAEAVRKQREDKEAENPKLVELRDTLQLLLPSLPPESREVAERALERSRA
jgi:voltage-gated potassium channel